MDNLDSLISFVYKMFAQIGESRYILVGTGCLSVQEDVAYDFSFFQVIDMSWARVSNDTKQRVYQEISKMSSVFEYRYVFLVSADYNFSNLAFTVMCSLLFWFSFILSTVFARICTKHTLFIRRPTLALL